MKGGHLTQAASKPEDRKTLVCRHQLILDIALALPRRKQGGSGFIVASFFGEAALEGHGAGGEAGIVESVAEIRAEQRVDRNIRGLQRGFGEA